MEFNGIPKGKEKNRLYEPIVIKTVKPLTGVLKELVDKDKSIKNVRFAGAVTNVQDYLSAMDIFILPSRFEGLPMCALEAQVNGLYTIVSDKVSEETKCSEQFDRLPLDAKTWEDKIKTIDFGYDRADRLMFLDEGKASSSNMADEFKRIYLEEI